MSVEKTPVEVNVFTFKLGHSSWYSLLNNSLKSVTVVQTSLIQLEEKLHVFQT